jgi:ferric-dicitrate binding protein FerR (iron transport regulator)
VFSAAGEITLERGALYVDAGPGAASPGRLAVITPAGSIRHVGTQYEARLLGSSLRVRVREGRVEWQSPAGRRELGVSGEQLTISNNGAVERAPALLHGESWNWIAETSPGIVIEGLPLDAFLSWAARELGWKLVYATPSVAAEAAGVVLHGSIEGLAPRQALDAVLATTRVRAAVQGDSLVLSGPEFPTTPAN